MALDEIKIGKIFNRDGNVIIANRDVTQNITHIHQRALSAIEEADVARSIENRLLAVSIERYSARLQSQAEAGPNLTTPYRGLLPYQIADSEAFFGRGLAITELQMTLERGKLAILHAESGAGKTSLLQAGIIPHILAEKHLPVLLRPYNISPSQALKELFLSDPNQTPILAAAPLHDVLFKMIQILGTDIRLFIIVDQFEEFFDYVPDEKRKEFIDELGKCLDDVSLNVHWLLAMRGEAFSKLSDFRPRIRSPFDNECALRKFIRAEAETIIKTSAQKFNLSFEEGLVDQLLDDLGNNEIAPPQLQLVCSALVKSLSDGQTIFSNTAYRQAGAVKGILAEYLSRVLDQYRPAERVIVRRVLEALVSSVPKRVLRSYSDLSNYLEKFGVPRQELDLILTKLTEDRLLHVSETDTGLNYELVHDYLLTEIKLDPAVKKRKQIEELLEQAFQNWNANSILTGKDTLNIIEPQLLDLKLDQDRGSFLYYSATQVKDGKQLRAWKQLIQPETKAKILLAWQKKLISREREQRQMAEKILTPLWKEFFFPVGLYLVSKRWLSENRMKFLAALLGVVVFAILLLLSVNNTYEPGRWKPIAGYTTQCFAGDNAQVEQISSSYKEHENIAVVNKAHHSICLSTDNGNSWFSLVAPDLSQEIRKIQIVDEFLFVLSGNKLIHTTIAERTSRWVDVNLPNKTPAGVMFTVNPQNPAELWLTTGDGILYHTTDKGGLWDKNSELPIHDMITALGTNGTSVVFASGKEIWSKAETTGAPISIKPKIPLAGEIKAIEPYSANIYYVLVDQQGVFVLNVEQKMMSQGVEWEQPQIAALSASNENVIISFDNSLGLQCLHTSLSVRFFGLYSWSITTTPYCP